MTDLQQELTGWFAGRIPDDWFTGPLQITYDRDEILVVGALSNPKIAGDEEEDVLAAACDSRIEKFRSDTRDRRARLSSEAEHLFNRSVAWGADCGDRSKVFTNLSVPVMTRLRMTERLTLDTLIDSGVARSRSDALNWCVRLVSQNQAEWLDELRHALVTVEKVRSAGPDPGVEG